MSREDNNIDELSINSNTNEKINKQANKQTKFVDYVSYGDKLNNDKPQFKIDWRQLSYFQKSDPYPIRLINKFINRSYGKEHQIKDLNYNSNEQQYHKNDQLSIYSDSTLTSVNSDNIDNQNYYKTNNSSEFSSLKNNSPKQILNSLDGCFKSGQLSAILGPSGAGKSTFLSTLFGSKQESAYGQTKVTWFVDSDDEAKKMTKRPLKTAILPQHDHLLHHLTVYETLIFASKIKNSFKTNKNENKTNSDKYSNNFHRQNVKRVAKMLKLIDCLDTRCGKLSGGQYKRVSIAQELLSEPDVIILDEPTSGLDAMTCLTTILTLKSIVKKHPMSIILTIHQPDLDVFNLFDHIYVIAQGGLAIYEGPPNELVETLKQVNLTMPSTTYNPARFIVENAFLMPESGEEENALLTSKTINSDYSTISGSENLSNDCNEILSSSEEEEEDVDDDQDDNYDLKSKNSYLKRSVLSITEAISGREMVSGRKNKVKKDKKPLLNIGIQTLDGKLITSEQLSNNNNNNNKHNSIDNPFIQERLSILKRLNLIQKSRYYGSNEEESNINDNDYKVHNLYKCGTRFNNSIDKGQCRLSEESSFSNNDDRNKSIEYDTDENNHTNKREKHEKSSAKSDYSSAAWSVRRHNINSDDNNISERSNSRNESSVVGSSNGRVGKSISLIQLNNLIGNNKHINKNTKRYDKVNCSLQMFETKHDHVLNESQSSSSKDEGDNSSSDHQDDVEDEFVVDFGGVVVDDGNASPSMTMSPSSNQTNNDNKITARKSTKLRRQFDKRLSAKHNCSKNNDYPIWYHSFVLTHRTWLSIIRDPIFFGIQACMHTTIPILLSLIFGSVQEEGCPRIGNFDLVEFAYSNSENMIQGTVRSIRQSIGNIGIVFFEMFVLSFSINCITALVFPLDMYVLLKEYRNGWYSLRSYFIGRTLADLPVPIVLHSIGMSILYYLTGQPQSLWRFTGIIILVISSSLVAQSVGLTIGALLMKSSQSAVLAAAGIVAPFFALSGFIVRIHTLPLIAQIGAKASYLYYLLNGFIILRYGFDRCQCKEEDFELNEEHQIPNNLHTLASIWIGTYSNEYSDNNNLHSKNNSLIMNSGNSTATNLMISNRTNVDPNIDVVDKMMTAFKMANSYGHQINNCSDVLPYAMLDFNLRDHDIYLCFIVLILMIIVSRLITFSAIYYKIRSFS